MHDHYAGPGPGPGPGAGLGSSSDHERRLFIAMLLCAAVTVIFMQRIAPRPMPPGSGSGSAVAVGSGSGAGSPAIGPGSSGSGGTGTVASGSGSGSGSEAPVRRIEPFDSLDRVQTEALHALEHGKVRYLLTNRGAVVTSARLKGHANRDAKPAKDGSVAEEDWLPITPGWDWQYQAGPRKGHARPRQSTFALQLRVQGYNDAPDPDGELWRLKEGATETAAIYSLRFANGLQLIKRYELGADGSLSCSIEIYNSRKRELTLTASVTTVGGVYRESETYTDVRALLYPAENGSGSVEKDLGTLASDTEELEKTGQRYLTASGSAYPVQTTLGQKLHASCAAGKYFACVAKVDAVPNNAKCVLWARSPRLMRAGAPPHILAKFGTRVEKDYYHRTIALGTATVEPLKLAGKTRATFKHTLQVGTCKELEERPYEGELVNFGMFSPISALLLWALKLLYGVIGTYGWSIVVLTLIVKLLLHPLIKRGQISMAEFQEGMKKIQPELDELRKKYANNPGKQNEEMIKLYKKHDMQMFPLGGCMPMFLQMPILLGLFYGLGYSGQLRQQSFLWIEDLALPDRLIVFDNAYFFIGDAFNILPLAMTAVWFIQHKMMPQPTAMDPNAAQTQKIMKWMPIFFGFLLYNFASGLCLYWFTSNLIGIFEQKLIKRQIERRKEELAAEAAAGGGDDAGGGDPDIAPAKKAEPVEQIKALSPAEKAAKGRKGRKGKKKKGKKGR